MILRLIINKTNRRSSLISAALLLLASCATVPPVVREVHEPIVQREAPGATLQALEDGRRVMLNRCTSCHWPPNTRKHPKGNWARVLEKMAPKAKLDAKELALLSDYLKVVTQPDFKPARQAADGSWVMQ